MEEHNLNPVVKIIQEILWVVRRVRLFLEINKLYLVSPPSWTISSLYILGLYLNFQLISGNIIFCPTWFLKDVLIMNPKIGEQNFL